MKETLAVSPVWGAVLLVLFSFLAGVLNGMLGTGGGVVLIFVLLWLLGKERGKEAFVISSFAILVFSLVSAVAYGKNGSLAFSELPRFALPAATGGVLGALLLSRLRLLWVKRIFACVLLYSGRKTVGVL